jgi:hypothetical protein
VRFGLLLTQNDQVPARVVGVDHRLIVGVAAREHQPVERVLAQAGFAHHPVADVEDLTNLGVIDDAHDLRAGHGHAGRGRRRGGGGRRVGEARPRRELPQEPIGGHVDLTLP